MQPLRLTRRPLSVALTTQLVTGVLQRIRDCIQPERVLLFGSAARGEMTDQSDLDFLVVMATAEECRRGSRAVRTNGPIAGDVAVDIVWITEAEFQRKRLLGGVCMVAEDEGQVLYKRSHDEK